MSERTGACLCGQVSYTLKSEPLTTRICWCKDCQRISANGTVNVVVPAVALEVQGELAEYSVRADSGNTNTRWFCQQCGTHLFGMISARPDVRTVRAGTLNDPSSIQPQSNIWTGSAPTWACWDKALESFAQQPPAPKPTA